MYKLQDPVHGSSSLRTSVFPLEKKRGPTDHLPGRPVGELNEKMHVEGPTRDGCSVQVVTTVPLGAL